MASIGLVLQIACTATGGEREPAGADADVAPQPTRPPDRVTIERLPPPPPALELDVEVIARAGKEAKVHVLEAGWSALEESGRVRLIAPDGSIHDDPELSSSPIPEVDSHRVVLTIGGRWPDALYAGVGARHIDVEKEEDPTPKVYRWKNGWITVDNEATAIRPRNGGVGPPRWLYNKITPWRGGGLLAHRAHYDVVQLSAWHVFRTVQHDDLWIVGAETALPLHVAELLLFDSTPSGVAFAFDSAGTIHRCTERNCSVVARVKVLENPTGIAMVGETAVLWGVEKDCYTPDVLFGTCLTEISPAGKSSSVLRHLDDIQTISVSLDRTMWITAGEEPRGWSELWQRTSAGELRRVSLRLDGESLDFVGAFGRDREVPVVVGTANRGYEVVVTQPRLDD